MEGIHETSINLFMNLTPPGAQGEGYGNLAVDLKGVPIGETPSGKAIASLLGYSDTDTIGPALDEIVKMAANLNIGIMISGNGSIDHTINVYLNTVDPAKPGLPPVKSLLVLLERDLAAGKIGDVKINVIKDGNTKDAKLFYQDPTKDPTTNYATFELLQDNLDGHIKVLGDMSKDIRENLDIADDLNAEANGVTPTISVGKGQGGNPWLSGNAYVTFLVVFMEMQRMLMQNKVVQGNIELAGMNMTVELAFARSDLIMEIAKQNQMIHIVTAIMSAVSITISVIGLGFSAGAGASSSGKFAGLGMEGWTTFGAMGAAFEKLATAITQAATDLTIAAKEGRKEVLQAFGALAQRMMEKAGETFKSQEDAIMQLLQTLDKIRDNLQQAIAASLRK